MRLIDAEALIEYIDVGHLRHPSELAFSEIDMVNMLNHVSTAYDADKVVAELTERAKESAGDFSEFQDGYYAGMEAGFRQAIQIVKGGGVDGD